MRYKMFVGFQIFASVILALLVLCGPAGANDVGRDIDATGIHAPVVQGLGVHAMRDNGLAHASANGLLHDIHSAAALACAACHARVPPEPAPGFQTCIACHGTMIDETHPAPAEGPDPHLSPHLAAGEVPECTACHSGASALGSDLQHVPPRHAFRYALTRPISDQIRRIRPCLTPKRPPSAAARFWPDSGPEAGS